MAVRIPGYLSTATIDTDRGGMPRVNVDNSLGRALQGFGGALSNAAEALAQEQQQRDLFDDNVKYQLHKEKTQTALFEAEQSMRPDGAGFKDGFFTSRQPVDQQWLESISPANREKFRQKWQIDQENFGQAASKAEFSARGKYELESLNSALDLELRKISNNPAHKAAAVETLGALLGNTTAIPETEKVKLKKDMAAMLDGVAAKGEYKGDPEGLAQALGISNLFVKSKWQATGDGVTGKATAYGPGYGGQEGGPNDARGRKVATLEDFAAGKVDAITIAGNKQFEGRRYTIPEITFTDSSGKTKTLKNVPAVVTDTGDAFKSAPEGRFDIPVAANMAPDALSKQPFSGQDLQFIPVGSKASAKIVSGDADLRNLSPAARGLLDGIAASGVLPEIKVHSGYRDADRNAAAGGAKGSQHIHGNALDLDVSGLSDAQKSALLQSAIANGARGIGIYKSGNSIHIDTRQSPAFWGPGADAYAGASIDQFPAWAQPHLQALSEGKVAAPGDPRFGAIPFGERVKMVESAFAERDAAIKAQKAEMKAFQADTKENFALAIETGDTSVTRSAILEAQQKGAIDAGHAVALLKAYDEKAGKDRAVLDFLSGLESGNMDPAPFDGDRQKGVDGAFDLVKKNRPEMAQAFAEEASAKGGAAPKGYVETLRGDIASTDPAKVLAGLQKAQRLMDANRTALARDGFDKVEKAAVGFRHMVEDLGYTPEEAARRHAVLNDPAARKPADAATIEKAAKKLTVADVTDAFDSAFEWEPKGGFANPQAEAMLGDYRDLFSIEYEASGDEAVAKARAIGQMRKMYGKTQINGESVLMKHPPENHYPPLDGSHGWMRQQLVDAAKEATGKAYEMGKVFIVSTRATDADVRAKQRPGYDVWVFDKDENGNEFAHPITGKGRFVFDLDAAMNKPERLAERKKRLETIERQRQENETQKESMGFMWDFMTNALAP